MTDYTTGDLERRVVLAIREATGSGWPPDKPPTENELNYVRAALKAHAEWRESKGLVVVPKLATPIMTQAAADELNPYTNKEASYELSCEVALNSWEAMIAAAQQEDTAQ